MLSRSGKSTIPLHLTFLNQKRKNEEIPPEPELSEDEELVVKSTNQANLEIKHYITNEMNKIKSQSSKLVHKFKGVPKAKKMILLMNLASQKP
jgi:hypothetical protein